MKRVKKIFLFVVFMFLGAFTLASCGEENTSSNPGGVDESVRSHVPSQPALTEAEVKTNFDTYAKSVKLSKASINQTMNQAVAAGSAVDPSEALGKISIPNSKATMTNYNGDTKAKETDVYLWQKDKVIYFAPDLADVNPEAIKLDLNEALELFNSVKENTPTATDTDYVGMILSLVKVPSGFDIDQYLSKISFTGDDFDYANGWFTLKNEKIAAIVSDFTGAPTEQATAILSQYFSKLELKIGFDGRYFTGFSFEVDPVSNISNQYVKASLILNYEYNLVVGAELKFGANIVIGGTATDGEYTAYSTVFADATITANALGVNADVKANVKIGSTTVDVKATAKANKDGLNVSVKESMTDGSDTVEGETALNLTATKFTFNVSVKGGIFGTTGVDITKVDMTLDNFVAVSGTATVNVGVIDSGAEIDKVVITFNTKDVTIPANVIAKEEKAVNVLDYIKGSIGGGHPSDSDVPSTDIK